ncbi:MAG: hypothetical protein ACK4NS_11975 [Saprospiraceae bacterium]
MSHVIQIFIAYARRDDALLDEFRMHLKPLERGRKIQIWYHCLNEPGAVWDYETKRRLYVSDIILFLISADAIASDFFYEKEVSEVLERHLMGEVRVALMILRPCAWEATSLAKLQAIPQNGKPVVFWSDREKAYADAARALLAMADFLEQHKREKAAESHRLRETADHRAAKGTEASSVHAATQQRQQNAGETQRRYADETERKELQAEYAYYIAEARRCKRRRDWPGVVNYAQAALALAPGDNAASKLVGEAEVRFRQSSSASPPYLRWASITAGALLAFLLVAKAAGSFHRVSREKDGASAYREDWRRAESENTLPAWTDFLAKHPNAKQSEAARQHIERLNAECEALINDALVALELDEKDDACQRLRAALRINPANSDIRRQMEDAGCSPD